jgi:capsule polysaccharide export protein KpsE/RkpR
MKESLASELRSDVERLHRERSLEIQEIDQAARPGAPETLRIFWEQRRFLFRVAACGGLAAVLIAFLTASRYQSTTRLMPSESYPGSSRSMLATLPGGSAAAALTGDLMGLRGSGPLFVGILGSRTVEDRLVQEFGLEKVYGTRLREDACRRLEDNTQISEDHNSGIITIVVTDKNPQRAAAMAKAYVDELNRLVSELTTSAAHRERVFLEERLKQVKRDLDAAAKDFSEFSSKNTTLDIKDQGRAMVEAAATLQGHLIAAQSELEGLKQIYTDNNVAVRSVRARIAELQKQLQKLGGQSGKVQAYQSAGQLYPSIRQLPLLGATYGDLSRRVQIQETVYETLTKQYELARVEEAKEIPTVQVLDVAQVPQRKSGPHRLRILLFVPALSLALGMLWLLAEARWAEVPPDDYRKFAVQAAVTRISAPWRRVDRSTVPANKETYEQ